MKIYTLKKSFIRYFKSQLKKINRNELAKSILLLNDFDYGILKNNYITEEEKNKILREENNG